MSTTAYLILWINQEGTIYDAQVAGEFPVTQMVSQGKQVQLLSASAATYEEAQNKLLRVVQEAYPWVFRHPTLQRQMATMSERALRLMHGRAARR